MRPSERRALKEEKLRAEERERELEARAEKLEAGEDEPGNYTVIKDKKKTRRLPEGYHREGFIQSHIKLITFIVCVVVFLAAAGPFSIYKILQYVEESSFSDKTDGRPITMNNAYGLSDKGELVRWSDFTPYNYEDLSYDHENGRYIKRQYNIEDSSFYIWVGGNTDKGVPDYVWLINGDDGTLIDLLREDARAFVATGKK